MKYLKSLWLKIPLEWKKEATSFLHTFVASLVLTIAMQIEKGDIPMSKDALLALGLAAIRSAWKVAFNKIFLKK